MVCFVDIARSPRSPDPLLQDRPRRERGAAFRSDRAKRGAATRRKRQASGTGAKRRSGDAIRRDLLKVDADLEATRRAYLKAKTPTSSANHKAKERRLIVRRDKLRTEAKGAGLQL